MPQPQAPLSKAEVCLLVVAGLLLSVTVFSSVSYCLSFHLLGVLDLSLAYPEPFLYLCKVADENGHIFHRWGGSWGFCLFAPVWDKAHAYFACLDFRKNHKFTSASGITERFPSCYSILRDPEVDLLDQISLCFFTPRATGFVKCMGYCLQGTCVSWKGGASFPGVFHSVRSLVLRTTLVVMCSGVGVCRTPQGAFTGLRRAGTRGCEHKWDAWKGTRYHYECNFFHRRTVLAPVTWPLVTLYSGAHMLDIVLQIWSWLKCHLWEFWLDSSGSSVGTR